MNVRSDNPTADARRKRGRPLVDDKRRKILDAALREFAERGYHGTSVPEVAQAAGVGTGSLYRYFEHKEALVNVIYREQKLQFAHVVLDGFPMNAPTREQFRNLWMRMARYATAHMDAFIFLELHHHARYLDSESRAVEQRMIQLFTSVVVGAQARGELKAGPPRLLMGVVMGAFVGVIRNCVDEGKPVDEADWKLAEQCVWEAVRN
jgi:AcrR family transcriptional regulator